MYSFHASASVYTGFWNSSYGAVNGETVAKITRRQVWQAFIQESIRMVAVESKINLEIRDGLSISDKTKQAFAKLGNQGIIPLAKGHACRECSQPYREPSDVHLNIDAAAVVGMDEQRNVPPLIEEEENSEDGMMAVDEENIPIPATINQALQNPPDNHQDSMDVDITTGAIPDTAPDVGPKRDVTMDVLDGLVMGPLCCAADNCNAELQIIRVVHFVHIMNHYMVQNVACMTVQMLKSVQPKHVKNINLNREHMFVLIAMQIYLV